ncbi:stage V sporulation protein D [Clostridium fallax]|uniref:Stage V sporulation protein D (Sporulation-specific penicillin-binding protein) n=1 Tax=Clostridium fallax TaxID=1533 RepID=A0A1M4YJG8_9CLOT|nr:stage V sporulation protein D [Clostridium fallax]SHF05870.1 stage V sporulation protein D (sporulation-specific penicillin-binding protein) [Clostridium fallax]SQB06299.1 stage V sporulation protein D [Clostridium fallax]
MSKRIYRDNATIKKRMWVTVIFLLTIFLVLTCRLTYVMIFKGKELSKKAVEQWTSEVRIDARRGKILDRNGEELAVSANVYRIDFDLNSIRSYLKKNELNYEDIATKIAEAVDMETEDVVKKLDTRLPSGDVAGAATLLRRIEKDKADKVRDLNIKGVIVSPDTKRYYPNDNFLSHVLGSTNVDGKGLTGIELQYNDVLSGKPGVRMAEIDKRSDELPYTISTFTAPENGSDLILTIDEQIQFFAEKAADIALKDNKAKTVSVIVMDPNNGEILAMSNKPDFNPNTPYEGAENFEGKNSMDKLQKMWRNRSVSDSFEPGSIFKVITAIAGLEENVADKGETYVCGGSTTVQNRRIKCWKSGGHGTQSFSDILKNSCNVGLIQLGQSIGKEKLNEYIKKFGLGKKSGVDLPGEAKGIIKATKDITEIDLATISFGQTDTVNPIQFLTAFNAIANGGTLIQPHIMKEVVHTGENGEKVVEKNFKPKTEKVVSEEKTKILREYLERVVTEGSAKNTKIEGYTIGGKTGTAQKVNPENGTYEAGKYISSFVAMTPIDKPKITIMISIDEPSTGVYYAGQITTPIAKMLFTDIFNYYGENIPKDEVEEKKILIPDVRGMTIKDGKKLLIDSGLEFDIEGNGELITDINPKPGYSVKEGTKINLYSEETSNYNKDVVVPDFINKSKESTMKILESLGLKGKFEGNGTTIIEQSIKAYETVTKGTTIKFKLSEELGD